MALIEKLLILIFVSFVFANYVPSPPEIINIECRTISAILSWTPIGDTAPVTGYIIQYQTSFSPGEWINYEFTVPLKETSVRLILSPWTIYTFRVLARNNAGISLPSNVSNSCFTVEDIPYMHPSNVYGRGNGPNNLVIQWKPMPPIDHNAPGFFYKVYWKPIPETDTPSENVYQDAWHYRIVNEWEQHKLMIENLPKLRPYKIKVEAYNSHGKGRPEAVEVIGYSDEDKPTDAPQNLRVVELRDGRSATLSRDPVDPLTTNGHFKGIFKII
jgi:neuronal cell adhesion protein